MKKIYFIPGIEMDPKIYRLYKFEDFQNHIIKWPPPFPKEPFSHYAKRIAEQITDKEPYLIGFSFGGMLAIEIAKILTPKKVILVSSAKTCHEYPFYIRFLAKTKCYHLLPKYLYTQSNPIRNYLLGTKNNKQQKLAKIHSKLPRGFMKWAIDQSIKWNNTTIPKSHIIHLHGSEDNILPIKKIKDVVEIKNAGHLMFAYQARIIRQHLKKILSN